MKLRIVHLWIVTTIISFFIHWYAGMMLVLATIVILSQEKEIEILGKMVKPTN